MQSFVAAGGNETLMWSSKSRHPKFSAHAYYADMVSYFCHLGEKLYPFYPLVNVDIANWNITMLLMGKSW